VYERWMSLPSSPSGAAIEMCWPIGSPRILLALGKAKR
jgi:hypothetical protein